MDLFYIENYQPGQTEVALSVEESHHLKRVLRKSAGDRITLTDGKGHRLLARMTGNHRQQVLATVEQVHQFPFPPENEVDIALAIIRPNRMDWAVEKLTEIGIRRLIPLLCHYNSIKTIKMAHLKRIAISAIKQSGQFHLPQITEPMLFTDWLAGCPVDSQNCFLAHPRGSSVAQMWNWGKTEPRRPLTVAIGPEGGFHQSEIETALSRNIGLLRLGATILRAETAAVVAAALLKQYLPASPHTG